MASWADQVEECTFRVQAEGEDNAYGCDLVEGEMDQEVQIFSPMIGNLFDNRKVSDRVTYQPSDAKDRLLTFTVAGEFVGGESLSWVEDGKSYVGYGIFPDTGQIYQTPIGSWVAVRAGLWVLGDDSSSFTLTVTPIDESSSPYILERDHFRVFLSQDRGVFLALIQQANGEWPIQPGVTISCMLGFYDIRLRMGASPNPVLSHDLLLNDTDSSLE
jgi:hypothetical protein